MTERTRSWSRRGFLAASAACAAGSAAAGSAAAGSAAGGSAAAGSAAGGLAVAAEQAAPAVVRPPEGKRILLSCKLGMIERKVNGKNLSLTERLALAGEAGFDGVDLDQAADYSPEEARAAVAQSGVFVHNAINHAHWSKRLTSPNAEDRAAGRANVEHCIRVSHAAGGSGVLIVVG
ncbi:MAG: hypothetical protein FJ276_13075, partial [Planctomycetes bacterium]|nr:hypothetical protein [Planctomycetota bacterium]